jgi:hypothetical protein
MMLLISAAVVALLAVLAVGVVSAQEQTATPEPSTSSADANGSVLSQLLQVIADDLSLQPQDILQQMRGQTLADIIKANNGDLDKITADITAAVTEHVKQAVTDGVLTQERADQILSNLDSTVKNALQGSGFLRGFVLGNLAGRQPNMPRAFGFGGRNNQRAPQLGGLRPDILGVDVRPLLNAVQDALKLNPRDIAQELRDGKTLSDVITSHGGDPAAIENAALATATQKLDQVRENGSLTLEQETAMINGLKAFYDAALNGNFRMQPPQPATTTSAPI